jgi:hypothetical protein
MANEFSDLDLVQCKHWSLFHPDPVTITPRWLLVLLAILFGIAAAFVAWRVNAQTVEPPQYVHEEGSLSIRLMRSPCADATTLSIIVASGGGQYLERFKAIESTWPHRDGSLHEYAGCWLELAEGELGVEHVTLLAHLRGWHAGRRA